MKPTRPSRPGAGERRSRVARSAGRDGLDAGAPDPRRGRARLRRPADATRARALHHSPERLDPRARRADARLLGALAVGSLAAHALAVGAGRPAPRAPDR